LGFLKFLKKEKKGKIPLDESLDVPPPPPSIIESVPKPGFEEKLPKELPSFKFKEEKPMPPIEEKLPELPKEEKPLDIPAFHPLEEAPKFVPKPPIGESPRKAPLPRRELPKIKPSEHERLFYEKMEKSAVREERKLLREGIISGEGPLYIRLDKFKGTLKSISVIRGDLKKSDEMLLNLVKSKEEKDKEFEKWRNLVVDIQKKLIFIDKTLFKDQDVNK